MAADETVTNDYGAAGQYTIVDGQLFSAAGGQFSTNTVVADAPFVASTAVGDITRSFSAGGILTWANPAFANGVASYCSLSSVQVLAVFDGTTPAGCTAVVLEAIACAGVGASAAGNGATGGITIDIGFTNIIRFLSHISVRNPYDGLS